MHLLGVYITLQIHASTLGCKQSAAPWHANTWQLCIAAIAACALHQCFLLLILHAEYHMPQIYFLWNHKIATFILHLNSHTHQI